MQGVAAHLIRGANASPGGERREYLTQLCKGRVKLCAEISGNGRCGLAGGAAQSPPSWRSSGGEAGVPAYAGTLGAQK